MAGDSSSYPKKYWWVVVVGLPVVLALIALIPQLLGKQEPSPGPSAPAPAPPTGGTVATITGDNNKVSIDNSSQMTIINNVSVIADEYRKQTGQVLPDDLKEQIERAVDAAMKKDHGESIRLFEQVAAKVPVPAVYNNLGVEYARTRNVEASQRALNQAIDKDPGNEPARKNLALLGPAGERRTPPVVTGPGVRFESSGASAILVERLNASFAPLEALHVVDAGAGSKGGMYSIRYQPEPETPVLVEPKTYDLLAKTAGGGVFVLASGVDVKEATLARINPNALVGAVEIRPLTRQGFPDLKEIAFVDRSKGPYRPIRQSTDKLGVTLPVAPGAYDVVCKTADNVQFDLVRNFEIKAGERARIDTDNEVAAIVVYEPNIKGLNVKAIYALRAGTNEIAGKSTAFGKPMMVYAGEVYDVALEQPAGLTRIRNKLTPSRGAVTEVR